MAAAVQSSTNLFRRLAWSANVPLEIRLADASGPVDRYFVSRPRHGDADAGREGGEGRGRGKGERGKGKY
jgi:hypothetical protein